MKDKKPLHNEHEYDANQEAASRRAAICTLLRWNIIAEAKTSVALDKDPNCHTCNDECTEFPQCPGNQT